MLVELGELGMPVDGWLLLELREIGVLVDRRLLVGLRELGALLKSPPKNRYIDGVS